MRRGTLASVTSDPAELVERLDFPAALLVARGEEILFSAGIVGQEYRWASSTKLVTALAALVAVERHLVRLEDAAGPEGSTVEHLLAHTSGVPFDSPAPIARPGARRIYSNSGYDLLAEHLAKAVGAGFEEWAEEAVLVPLGMSTTIIHGSAAHGATGTTDDLLRLAQEWARPTLITPELHARATSVAFPGLPGILPGFGRQQDNTWGLGPEIRGHKHPHWTGSSHSPRTYGHFGQAGSFIWVDPEHDLIAAFLGERPFGAWAVDAWPVLNDAILATYAA